MFTPPSFAPRGPLVACVVAVWAFAPGLACAQSATNPVSPVADATIPLEQKVEHIVWQDAGSRVEELRVGGQTRSIQVQTRSRAPAYLVQPLDNAGQQGPQGEGKARWPVLQF